jgi:hypothetical protein
MTSANRLRYVCLGMAAACLIASGWRAVSAFVPLFAPTLSSPGVVCTASGCAVSSDLTDLLPTTARPLAWRDPDGRRKLAERAAQPGARAMLAAAAAVKGLPMAVLFLALAAAFVRFSKGALFGALAITWLRRATAAGVLAVLAEPISATLRATALVPALTGRPQVLFVMRFDHLGAGLFVAAVIWVAVWALQEGRRARAELAGYV